MNTLRAYLSASVVVLAAVLALALGACSREAALRCGSDSIYLDARTAGALQIPDDLTVPDDSERLVIPQGGINADDEPVDGCLEHSPAYRDSQ